VKHFLTQALVDYRAIAKHRIWDQGDWHKLVWQAFNPIEGDRGPRQFLYSVEETPSGCKTLILSDQIPTRPDWCPASGWATKTLPDNFLVHSRYIFGLTASATRIVSTGDIKKRVSLARRLTPEDDPQDRLLDWLERKGALGGFRIYRNKTSVLPLDVEKFSNSNKQAVTVQYVRFAGVLDVTDRTLFTATFNAGVGRAKSYGAGLLLLKPIQ